MPFIFISHPEIRAVPVLFLNMTCLKDAKMFDEISIQMLEYQVKKFYIKIIPQFCNTEFVSQKWKVETCYINLYILKTFAEGVMYQAIGLL